MTLKTFSATRHTSLTSNAVRERSLPPLAAPKAHNAQEASSKLGRPDETVLARVAISHMKMGLVLPS
jgi:hypothetical protein